MRKAIFISALLFLAYWSVATGYACSDTIISSVKTYTCDTDTSSRVFDKNHFTIPSGQKSITISLDVKVTSLCSANSPQTLAVASVGGKRVMDFVVDTDNTPTIRSHDLASSKDNTLYYINIPYPMNKWITMVGTIDGDALTYAGAIASPTVYETGTTTDTFTRMVAPDSTMKFSVCSGIDGANKIACQIGNVKFMYRTYSATDLYKLALGTEPVLIGLYKFKEGRGYTTKSEIDTLGSAIFGESTANAPDLTGSPAWVSGENVLEFTTKSQYLNFPSPKLSLSNNRANTFSFSVHFWFKATATPSNAGDDIFAYTSSDFTAYRIAVTIYDTLAMAVIMDNQMISNANTKFTLHTWTEVTVRVIILDDIADGKTTNVALELGGNSVMSGTLTTIISSSVFKPNDAMYAGGFIGQFADLRIFSPGAFYMGTTTCTSGCPFELGATNPATCFQPDCGAGSFASSCITCPSKCTSCSATNVCRTCPAGSGLSSGSCGACPAKYTAATFTSPCIKTLADDPTPETSTAKLSIGIIIGIAVGGVALAVIVIGGGCYFIRKRRMARFRSVASSSPSPQALPNTSSRVMNKNDMKIEYYGA